MMTIMRQAVGLSEEEAGADINHFVSTSDIETRV